MGNVLRGIVHGRFIELPEDLGFANGQAVELTVSPVPTAVTLTEEEGIRRVPKPLPGPPPGWRPDVFVTSAGLLEKEWTEEDDRILKEIEQERKSSKLRDLPK